MKISHFPNNLPSNADEVYPNLIDAINKTDELVDYFNQFDEDLSKKNLNSFSKSVINE